MEDGASPSKQTLLSLHPHRVCHFMPLLDCSYLMSTSRCLQHVYQSLCTSISLLFNSFLIFLILRKSPKKLGDYKWMMVYTAVFELAYTALDLLTEPTAYSHGYAFVVFRRYNETWTTRDESQILVLAWCGLFGSSMAVFGVHFVYRFGTVHHSGVIHTRMQAIGRNISVLFLVPVVYGIWWTVVCVVYCRYSPETYEYMRNITKTLYQLEIEEISYISAVFYTADPLNGRLSFNTDGWLAMFQFSLMVGSSMFCVFYLGFRCYSDISNQLSQTTAVSHVTHALHQQLFFALVGQTIIPLTLMYIPVCVFFFCPLLNIDIGVVSTFLTHTVTLYPALDPLPNMFIIKNYRNAIGEIWRKFKRTAHLTSNKTKSTMETVTSVHSTMRHLHDSVMI